MAYDFNCVFCKKYYTETITRNWGNTVYALLDQEGPFATAATPPGPFLFSSLARRRAAELRLQNLVAKYRAMRVEFIVHTNRTYLDYIYKKDVAHDEYEVKRVFDSGVAELLFPREIYRLDMAGARNELIRWFRQRIEDY